MENVRNRERELCMRQGFYFMCGFLLKTHKYKLYVNYIPFEFGKGSFAISKKFIYTGCLYGAEAADKIIYPTYHPHAHTLPQNP